MMSLLSSISCSYYRPLSLHFSPSKGSSQLHKFPRTHIKLTVSKQDNDQESICSSSTGEKEKQKRRIPKHVALILDGNRRWAKKQGLSTSEGHEAAGRRLRQIATGCYSMGTHTMSIFAFSTENWGRPEDEVNSLMVILERYIKSETHFFHSNKIKVSCIGRRTNIPESLLSAIEEVEEATKSYEGRLLIMAIDYSGRYDILQACKSLAEKAKNRLIQVEDIDDKAMEKELTTNCSEFPNPDLLIRTSGEHRISNFFLWQSAYTELYFPEVLWPDFGEADILEAYSAYQSRQRRFGLRI